MKTLQICGLALLLHLPISGAIVVEASRFLIDSDSGVNPTLNIVDESGGNSNSILLVGVTADSSSSLPASDVTLSWSGGSNIAGTQLITDSGPSNTQTSLWAFDIGNVAAGETVTFNNASSAAREVFSLLQVSGATLAGAETVAFGSNNGNATSASLSFSSLQNDAFVFGVANWRNNSRSITGNSANIDSISGANINNRGHMYMLDTAAQASSSTYSFNVNSDSDGIAFSAVALNAIPEPSSVLLLGLATLGLTLGLRRRS